MERRALSTLLNGIRHNNRFMKHFLCTPIFISNFYNFHESIHDLSATSQSKANNISRAKRSLNETAYVGDIPDIYSKSFECNLVN